MCVKSQPNPTTQDKKLNKAVAGLSTVMDKCDKYSHKVPWSTALEDPSMNPSPQPESSDRAEWWAKARPDLRSAEDKCDNVGCAVVTNNVRNDQDPNEPLTPT